MFLCGGTSPPTPPELRKGRAAMPHGPFAIHEVVRLGFFVFGWLFWWVLVRAFCFWGSMLPSRHGRGAGGEVGVW